MAFQSAHPYCHGRLHGLIVEDGSPGSALRGVLWVVLGAFLGWSITMVLLVHRDMSARTAVASPVPAEATFHNWDWLPTMGEGDPMVGVMPPLRPEPTEYDVPPPESAGDITWSEPSEGAELVITDWGASLGEEPPRFRFVVQPPIVEIEYKDERGETVILCLDLREFAGACPPEERP